MKKTKLFKSLLVAAGLLVGASAWAYTPTLTENYEVAGYKTKAYYNIANTNVDDMCPTTGDLRYRGSGYGLFNFGSGNRGCDITLSVSKDEILLAEFKDTQNRSVTINSISNCTKNSLFSNGDILAYDVAADASTLNINIGRGGCIIAFLVVEPDASIQTADYTINYVLGDETVKTSKGSGVVGVSIPTEASFYENNTKYYRADGEPESVEIGSTNNTFNINVRLAAKYTWTAKSNVGTFTASGETWEGETANVSFPLYVLNEGKLWTKAANNSVYNQSFTITENNQEFTLEYTETDIEAIFYTEAEDVVGMTIINSGNANARSSQRAAAYTPSENKVFTTLAQGKYKLVGSYYSATSAGGHPTIYAGNRVILDETTPNANATAISCEFVLANESNDIAFGKGGGSNAGFDYVYIQKLDDPTAEELAEAAAADEKADKTARVFNIIGLGNDWNTDHQMTQSTVEGEEDIYTFTTTMNVVGGEADEYFGYKLRQDSDWSGYQLPQNGNQSWKDQVDGIGKYTLTFTADVAGNTLTCEAVKADFTYAVVGSQKVDGNDVESDLFDGSWNTAATTDILTKGSDGKFTLSKKVALTAQYVEFKVVAKDGDDVLKWFGNGTYTDGNENNANYNFTSDGTYQVIFSFDGSVVSATAVKEETFTVAGCYKVGNDDQASFFGTAWDPTVAANNMILKEDGIYELKFTDVELTETGTITYKVVKDNAWGTAYPSSDATWGVAEAGIYDITFTFDPTNNNAVACNLAIKKDITSAGYATYCSSYAIDFASAGLSAYIAKIEGSAVTFAPIDDAPANTGVLLKGAEGSYKLPIVGSTTSDVNGNILVGTVTGCTAPANSFVLMDGTSGVGFYKATNAFNVGAHTAYIHADVAGARTFIAIEGEATGIEGIAAEKNFNGEIYNLQGQRVVKAQKGLYIINGKKVLVK